MHVTFNVKIGNSSEVITSDELSSYAKAWGLDQCAKDRYSWLFVVDLLCHSRVYGINPSEVIEEIRILEGHSPRISGTKPASEFLRQPLKGLWHKHYFSAQFLPKNIQVQLGKHGIRNIINEVFGPKQPSQITDEMIWEISRRATEEQFEQRYNNSAITGEWIVFAKNQGENFYLCMGSHNLGGEKIHNNIKSACLHQFPFLANIL